METERRTPMYEVTNKSRAENVLPKYVCNPRQLNIRRFEVEKHYVSLLKCRTPVAGYTFCVLTQKTLSKTTKTLMSDEVHWCSSAISFGLVSNGNFTPEIEILLGVTYKVFPFSLFVFIFHC